MRNEMGVRKIFDANREIISDADLKSHTWHIRWAVVQQNDGSLLLKRDSFADYVVCGKNFNSLHENSHVSPDTYEF